MVEFNFDPDQTYNIFSENQNTRRDYEASEDYAKDQQTEAFREKMAPIATKETAKVANDDDSGIVGNTLNFAKHAAIGVAKGVEEMGQTFRLLEDNAFHLPEPKTTAEGLAQGFGQYLPAFIPAAGAIGVGVRLAGLVGKTKKAKMGVDFLIGTAAGGVADIAAFDPKEPNAANFLLVSGAIAQDSATGAAVKSLLAQDDSDTEALARTKSLVTGMIAGTVLTGLFKGAGYAVRKVKGEVVELDGIPIKKVEGLVKNEAEAYTDGILRSKGVDPDDVTLFDVSGQELTSAGTSINSGKLPSVFNKVLKSNKVGWIQGGKNFDIGGGSFDNMTQALKEQEVDNHIYDPFNRDANFNADSITQAAKGQSDTATISNVLNVIKEPENQLKAIKQAHNALKEDGKLFITVYEGNKTGVGASPPKKPDQFQQNKKLAEYLPMVKQVFPEAEIHNGMIVASKRAGKTGIPKTSPTYKMSPEGFKKFGHDLPSIEGGIKDSGERSRDDYVRPWDQLSPEKKLEAEEIVNRWAVSGEVGPVDLKKIESMNFLKLKTSEDVRNVLQFLSEQMDIKKLLKGRIKTEDFDTASGAAKMLEIPEKEMARIIQEQAGNVRGAIKYVGATRALAAASMKKAEDAFELFVANGSSHHYEEGLSQTKIAYDMLASGGELSKASSDLLRSHKKMIGEGEALSNIKRGLRHSIIYNDPELSIKQSGWFVSNKNVDKIKITAKFGNEAKRTTSIPKIKGESKADFKKRATSEARRSELGAIDKATRRQSVSRANAMNKSFKARGRDAMLEIYVNGLLSSAKTFEVNLLGNSTAIITSVIDRAYAGVFKKGGVVTGQEAAELTKSYWKSISSLDDLWSLMKQAWRLEPTKFIKQDFIRPHDRTLSAEGLRVGGNL